MAVRSQQRELDSEAAQGRPIELITENGFSIVRANDGDTGSPTARGYTFVVRDRDGYELDIAVEIERPAMLEVFMRSAGRISNGDSYWICCAERHLADYLWRQDDYPSDDGLTVNQLTPDDLDLARRWKVDGEIL
jgi:hypothetical protein